MFIVCSEFVALRIGGRSLEGADSEEAGMFSVSEVVSR